MYADLDELVLSGKLFSGGSRSSSPARSPSPDHNHNREWPDNKDGGEDYEYSSDAERDKRITKIINAAPQDAPEGSIGMGPGRTGVKGVIRDRAEAQARARERRTQEIADLNRRMEKASLGGKTFLEEEKEKEWERMMLEGIPKDVQMEKDTARSMTGKGRGRFGHLREVSVKNFVSAVEKEARDVWVVVHLYDSSLNRCYALDTDLSHLARLNPDVKFLHARASSLGFASSTRPSRSHLCPAGLSVSRRITEEDEDDPYAYEDGEDIADAADSDEDGEHRKNEADVDLDMLPTLLVYRDGDLEYNWVRVDWEAGHAGVEELLLKHRILKSSGPGPGNCGLPSDDEDLWESDEDAS
ncbi:hypothetical protein DFH11DRAFT_1614591 [Phellopilus nigrolimitatus]|nr:hypothetical protein DFH11DRAFT_1614591 [Phellopilus nigrolimitatus]